ncbi:restriction endonuclease subunit S [Fusobacterium gonidiaformans]|uniref:restriction endonuclease subunit S n=1 Tax=Fusobacterium gonidiaformans TaxID=849 RepID=UPI00307D2DC2
MKYRLSDICHYVKGKVDVSELDNSTYISTENMLPDKGGVTEAASLPTTLQTQIYEKDDVLVSNIRPYFKKIWFADQNGGCSNDVLVFRANEGVEPGFLYYVLADDKFFDFSMATSKGTKMPRGDKKALMEYEVLDFNIDTQKKVASLLGDIDEKIRVNTEINDNLEQQAKAIYQQMFIDNPDSNWAAGTLSDIANITMGQSPSGSSYNEDGNGTIFFQGRAEFGFRFPSVRLFTTEPKRMACENDTLMSVRAPVGDLNVAHRYCCIGRGLAAIHSKNNHQSFVHYTMVSLKKQLDVFNREGTVFGSINRNALNAMPILIPSDEKLDKFESIVAPMDTTIRNNYDEICRLEKIRDSLLPKLISGEVDVSAIDL